MKPNTQELEKLILNIKQTQQLKQYEIADKLGVSAEYLSQMVHGKKPITEERLIELNNILGKDINSEVAKSTVNYAQKVSDFSKMLAEIIHDKQLLESLLLRASEERSSLTDTITNTNNALIGIIQNTQKA